MIRLTLTTGEFTYVAPEQITAVRPTSNRTQVYTTFATDKTDYMSVKETPLDVIRLKAAWESRFRADKLEGELPIFVHHDTVFGFQYVCCEYTHMKRKLLEARKGEKPVFDLTTGLPTEGVGGG